MRIAILGSTRGTNLLALNSAIKEKKLAATIEVVISDKPDALILNRAKKFNIPNYCIEKTARLDQETVISQLIEAFQIDLILLSGYMRILSPDFIARWRNKIINAHPSLLPKFAGMKDMHIHRAVIAEKINETGCTIHHVSEVVDEGEIILQKKIPVLSTDSPETLKTKVQKLEALALIETINQWHEISPTLNQFL